MKKFIISISFLMIFSFVSYNIFSNYHTQNISPEIITKEVIKHNQSSATCPADMAEVDGVYCDKVFHRCIKGGQTHKFQKSSEPMPYYCDEYEEGYAKCEGKQEPKHFCIDKYEYPGKMQIPMVMVTWYKAKELCEAQGKRLCGNDEWTTACEGPEHFPYPYGWKRDSTKCNIDHLWMAYNESKLASSDPKIWEKEVDRLSKRVPSGSMPGCVSFYGVYDMTGNVDEWSENITGKGKPFKSIFNGGHWSKGARNRCRAKTTSHDEKFAFYCEGFRCCSDIKK